MSRSLVDELEQLLKKLDKSVKIKGNKADLIEELAAIRPTLVELIHDVKRGKI